MINFGLGSFWAGLEALYHALRQAQLAVTSGHGNDKVNVAQHHLIKNNVESGLRESIATLLLVETNQACIALEDLFRLHGKLGYSYQDLYERLDRLRQDIEYGIKQEYFFHYSREMAKLVMPPAIEHDWKAVLASFPSSRREIETGIDCYALGDYPGCVFHMMRIAELGLRAIARERGVKTVRGNRPIEWGTWKDVSNGIRGKIDEILRKPPGPKRDAAQNFYDVALSDMRMMQGVYRDPTMHFREEYRQREAFDAISRVKNFMTILAGKLNEARPRRKIRWGL